MENNIAEQIIMGLDKILIAEESYEFNISTINKEVIGKMVESIKTVFSNNQTQLISTREYIDLLEYKLICIEKVQQEDSSWNYSIEEIKEQIKELKNSLGLM